MAFTLRINFIGMCLFAAEGQQAMHVLMPATGVARRRGDGSTRHGGGHGGESQTGDGEGGDQQQDGDGHGPHAVEMHAPRLLVDTAHLSRGGLHASGVEAHLSLRGGALEITGLAGPFDPSMPTELAHVGSPLKRGVLTDREQELLASRVTLRHGRFSGSDPGRCWDWRGSTVPMSHHLEWRIDEVPGDELEPVLRRLGSDGRKPLPRLFPVEDEIVLSIYHVPLHELPPDAPAMPAPAAGWPAHHFAAFEALLSKPLPGVPTFRPQDCNGGGGNLPSDRSRGSSSYTCMAGQSP